MSKDLITGKDNGQGQYHGDNGQGQDKEPCYNNKAQWIMTQLQTWTEDITKKTRISN